MPKTILKMRKPSEHRKGESLSSVRPPGPAKVLQLLPIDREEQEAEAAEVAKWLAIADTVLSNDAGLKEA